MSGITYFLDYRNFYSKKMHTKLNNRSFNYYLKILMQSSFTFVFTETINKSIVTMTIQCTTNCLMRYNIDSPTSERLFWFIGSTS